MGKSTGFGVNMTWVQILTPPPNFDCSELPLPHPSNMANGICQREVLGASAVRGLEKVSTGVGTGSLKGHSSSG